MAPDIVEWLRTHAQNQRGHEAADEIERLNAACKDKADLLRDAYAQVDHLREEFDRLERAYRQLRETYINTGMSQNTASNDEAKWDMDLIKRLRAVADMDLQTGPILAHTLDTAREAADEIERLRHEEMRLRTALDYHVNELREARRDIDRLRGAA